ncbi:MAG: hypothetical protein E6248_03995 [Clostridium sp.]|nr:hypothetical protein [Clostridium sp.]MDU5109583.1 hypothetical protein [Clostridium sp.]
MLALGFKAVNDIDEEVYSAIKDIKIIGDASSPRRIKHAVAEGFEVAINI